MEHASIARVLADSSEEISRRWLDRLTARIAVEQSFVFPSEDLLDGIPCLIEAIARHVGHEESEIAANLAAQLKARELGRLRYHQGFSARQILWEYEMLSSVMLHALEQAAITDVTSIRRMMEAIALIQRVTMEEYVDQAEARIRDREDRLRAFQSALTHELRNDIGVVIGGARMLKEDFVMESSVDRDRFVSMVLANAERLKILLDNLLELAKLDIDTRQNRNVLLRHAADETVRRLRSFGETRGVRVEIAPDFPALEVNAATVDFCLTNLLANAIKYSDPDKSDRWVRIRATSAARDSGRVALVEVIDNGRGVPEADREQLFSRFFRSANARKEDGSGIGLALVREFVMRIGGTVWAEFPPGQTVFVFTLPARRIEDG